MTNIYVSTYERRCLTLVSLFSLQLPKRYSNQEKILFYKQLAVLLSSGLTLLQALQLMGSSPDSRLVPICRLLEHSLQQGLSLSAAMLLQKDFFPSLAVTLVSAGEKSGQLTTMLKETARYYQQLEDLRDFVVKAALYPAFLLATAGGVLLFFLFYVLPIIASTVSSLQGKPSGFLQGVLAVKAFIGNYLPVLLMLLLFSGTAIYSYKQILQQTLLQLPILRTLRHTLLEIRFCRLLSLLLNSGISITKAVSLTASTLDDQSKSSQLNYFNQKLSQGMDPTTAARYLPGLFSPLTLELLSIGTNAGNLPQMLEEAGNIQEQRLQQQLTKIKELLGPSLLLIAALLTAAVICSALEPLFDLFTAIPEY